MAVYQLRTFGDIVSAVREECQIQASDTTAINRIKRDINLGYQSLASSGRWAWLQDHLTVVLQAYVSSGTATVTSGSATVTLSVAPASSKTGHLFATDAFNEIYRIESHTAGSTTLKLETEYNGASNTVNYKLWTDRIPLPTHVKEVLTAWHDHHSKPMDKVGIADLRRYQTLGPRVEQKPQFYALGDYVDPSSTTAISNLPAISTRASAGLVKTIVFASAIPTAIASKVNAGEPVLWRISAAGHHSYNGDILISSVGTTSTANDTITYTGISEYQESATADATMSIAAVASESDYDRYRELIVYPCLQQSRVAIHVQTLRDLQPLESDSDEPLIPMEDREVLLYWALSKVWRRLRNPEAAAENFGLYKEKLMEMQGKLQDTLDKPRLSPSKAYLSAKRAGTRNGGLGQSALLAGIGGGGPSGAVITGTPLRAAQFNANGEIAASDTVSTTELGYLDGVTSAIQTQLDAITTLADGKIYIGNGSNAATEVTPAGDVTIANDGTTAISAGVIVNADVNASAAIAHSKMAALTASRAMVTDGSGVASASSVTATTLGYLDATSSIQTQLDAKAAAADLTAHLGDTADAHDAAAISVADAGGLLTATDVEGALAEIAGEVDSHVADTSGAHAASAIAFTAAGTIAATDVQAAIEEVATDAATALSTHEADTTSVHGIADTSTLYRAGGTDVAVADGGTNISSYTAGDLLYATGATTLAKLGIGSSGQVLKVSGSSLPEWGAGAGAGGINYVSQGGGNADAETNATTGWTTYADGATATPVDLTGGSPTATWTAVSSNPLRGTYSFKFTAGAHGNGVAYTITPDRADIKKGAVMHGSFDYEVSATTATGDYTIWVYDVANSALIQPTGYQVQGGIAGVGYKHIFSFQLPTTGTTFRVAIHQAVASPGGNLIADNVSVGPQAIQYGAPITDTVRADTLITPNNFGSVATQTFSWRRTGDTVEGDFAFDSGSPQAAVGSITVPWSIDTAKVLASGDARLGDWTATSTSSNQIYSDGSTNSQAGVLFYDSSQGATKLTFAMKASTDAAGTSFTSINPFNFVNASGTRIAGKFRFPVAGWSSTVQMSSDTDTRAVAAILSGDPASATSGNPIIVPTVVHDSHGCYNASTGRYTVAVPGVYKVYGALLSASSATTLHIYKNAVSTSLAGSLDSNGDATFAAAVNCIAGDVIDIRPGGTVDATSMSLNIERLSGPSAVAANEKVQVQYTSNAGTVLTADTTNIDWSTKVVDTHGAWSGTVFTAPRADLYLFQGVWHATGSAAVNSFVYKNGSRLYYVASEPAATPTHLIAGAVYLLAGETISFRTGTGATLDSSDFPTQRHFLSIWSQG
jgi:hypothetical protein